MNILRDTLAEFGHRIGLDHLDAGPDGAVQLLLPSGVALGVDGVRHEDRTEILVYRAQPVGFDAPRAVRAALLRNHYRHGGPLPIQVAARGEGPDTQLLLVTRLPERAFTVQALEHAFDVLERLADALR